MFSNHGHQNARRKAVEAAGIAARLGGDTRRFDSNPGRSVPLGGREYPADAAGTQLACGTVVSGDDADKFRRAGFDTIQLFVQCSAKLACGEDAVQPGTATVLVAIERHGYSCAEIESWIGSDTLRPATGIYNGTCEPVAFGRLDAADIPSAHATLVEHLPGFQCFAVLS